MFKCVSLTFFILFVRGDISVVLVCPCSVYQPDASTVSTPTLSQRHWGKSAPSVGDSRVLFLPSISEVYLTACDSRDQKCLASTCVFNYTAQKPILNRALRENEDDSLQRLLSTPAHISSDCSFSVLFYTEKPFSFLSGHRNHFLSPSVTD